MKDLVETHRMVPKSLSWDKKERKYFWMKKLRFTKSMLRVPLQYFAQTGSKSLSNSNFVKLSQTRHFTLFPTNLCQTYTNSFVLTTPTGDRPNIWPSTSVRPYGDLTVCLGMRIPAYSLSLGESCLYEMSTCCVKKYRVASRWHCATKARVKGP